MTDDTTSQHNQENPYYIPPTAGPGAKPLKTPDKKPGSDWLNVVYFVIGTFVLFAAFQLYFVLQDLIRTWISDQFVPVVSAVYYIIIIVGGIWLLYNYIEKM